MSAVAEFESSMKCCASCGVTENDDIKLKKCTACYQVRYCSIQCQRDHRPKHKRGCKIRAAELRDELLFKQPESTYPGDCPICFLPLPLDLSKSNIKECCSKVICNGCDYANEKREIEGGLQRKCPFCRKAPPKSEEEITQRTLTRIEANDPVAMLDLAHQEYKENNHNSAIDWMRKASELGDPVAHMKLAGMYHRGHGVEKDSGKEIYHLEKAAIGGHAAARSCLGLKEWIDNRNAERAVKHWIIAVTQGEDTSIKMLMDAFKRGFVSKEELAAALRAHQAAVDATKSPQREAAV